MLTNRARQEWGLWIGLALLLCGGAGFAAPEVSSSVAAQALARLDERIGFYKNHFPSVDLRKALGSVKREELSRLVKEDPRDALGRIEEAHRGLDRESLPRLKREIFRIGSTVDKNPTTSGNVVRRRAILFEFADVVKRRGLVLSAYYPGGPSKFLRITLDTEATFKKIDERYATVARSVKSEVEAEMVASGGGGGGDRGGGSGGWGLGDEGGSSEASGQEDGTEALGLEDDVGGAGRALSSGGERWSTVLWAGVVLILVGSGLVVLLPRVATWSRGMLRRAAAGRMKPVEEDHLKTGLAMFQKHKFEQALEAFGKLAEEKGQRGTFGRYYRVLCHVRLDRKVKVLEELGHLDTAPLSNDEIYRLARACEDQGYLESARGLYRDIQKRDSSYKDVSQRLDAYSRQLGGSKKE